MISYILLLLNKIIKSQIIHDNPNSMLHQVSQVKKKSLSGQERFILEFSVGFLTQNRSSAIAQNLE